MITLTLSYLAYVAGSIAVTLWVGRALNRHGAILLAGGKPAPLAVALSDLLVMGFYLFHLGFALLILRYGTRAGDLPGAIETVSTKLGLVLILLAASHFIHLAVFSRLRPSQPEGHRDLPIGMWAQPLPAQASDENRSNEGLAIS